MEVIRFPERNEWEDLLARPVFETRSLDQKVTAVLDEVKENGDAAIIKYTEKFDKVKQDSFIVSETEKNEAEELVGKELKDAILLAYNNIYKFHKAQEPETLYVETNPGVKCWQKAVPVGKVGLYIPGGTAPLFSTVLMLAIPAKIAGCKEIVLCSPPGPDGKLHPAVVYAAGLSGVRKIFKIGGIQAVGAMAYGTESVPKVFKILGPGNQYVTAAKQIVSREEVAIDMPAGPSEVAVLADHTSNPVFIASDMLSQAEHGGDSQAILITTSESVIEAARKEIQRQLETLPRKEYAKLSLNHSRIVLVKSYDDMMEMVNVYAPEHLIISTANADDLAMKVENAGSVFIGEYTPESAGDYASGTNHTLPTNGYASMYSGVNLYTYYKRITFQKLSKEGLQHIGPAIEKMALAEDLTAHQRAVSLRLRNEL